MWYCHLLELWRTLSKKQMMKTHILLGIVFGAGISVSAQQVEDSIEMLPGYTNESFYSMSNDEQANVDNTNWDIAFDLNGFGSSVRSNGHTATVVYVYPNGTDWASVDTTGMAWNPMYNSETTWAVGAFDQSINAADPFDIGWGVYNPVTHAIVGDSLHIVKLASGDYKKVMLESLIGGVYSFKYADLNGSNEVSTTLAKSDFTDKNFGYFSLITDQSINREPTNDSWDIVFTRYIAELGPGVNYPVTGVLANKGVSVREASGINPASAVYTDYAVDSAINAIGWDWKTFNSTSFQYDITPDLSYFVQDQTGNVWHIVFSKFEGSSTGKVVFAKELVSSASIDDLSDVTSFGIYPNPANDFATVVFNSNAASVQLSIVDLSGKQVYQDQLKEQGLVTYTISTTDFNAGSYVVQLITANGITTKKLIVQ